MARPLFAQINLAALRSNVRRVRELAPDDLASQYLLAMTYRALGDMQPTDDGPEAAHAGFRAVELETHSGWAAAVGRAGLTPTGWRSMRSK